LCASAEPCRLRRGRSVLPSCRHSGGAPACSLHVRRTDRNRRRRKLAEARLFRSPGSLGGLGDESPLPSEAPLVQTGYSQTATWNSTRGVSTTVPTEATRESCGNALGSTTRSALELPVARPLSPRCALLLPAPASRCWQVRSPSSSLVSRQSPVVLPHAFARRWNHPRRTSDNSC
jgi:hypothetical protein